MKYYDLLQIRDYLDEFTKIKDISRVDDKVLMIDFFKEQLLFDLNPQHSAIYKGKVFKKNYNAPFDLALKKYFIGANIKEVIVPKDNRLLKFHCILQKSYKSYEISMVFEFTGKNTNVILIQNDIIIAALKHVVKSSRKTMPGIKYEELEPYPIKEKEVKKIDNFDEYFIAKFNDIVNKKLEDKKTQKLNLAYKKIEKLNQALNELEDEKKLEEDSKHYQKLADVLSNNLHNLKDYERNFTLKDFDGLEYKYELDNKPRFAINELYKNAKKLRAKAKNQKIEKELLSGKIDVLNKTIELIKETNDSVFLESIFHKKESKENKTIKNLGVLNFYFDDYKISVGTNEGANEYLLKNSKKDDLWFHVKDINSAHVFVYSNKTNIDYDLLEYAAKLCVKYSKLSKGYYNVDFTKRKNVKIKEKAYVNYVNYDTIRVENE